MLGLPRLGLALACAVDKPLSEKVRDVIVIGETPSDDFWYEQWSSLRKKANINGPTSFSSAELRYFINMADLAEKRQPYLDAEIARLGFSKGTKPGGVPDAGSKVSKKGGRTEVYIVVKLPADCFPPDCVHDTATWNGKYWLDLVPYLPRQLAAQEVMHVTVTHDSAFQAYGLKSKEGVDSPKEPAWPVFIFPKRLVK